MSVSRFHGGPDWRSFPTWQEKAEAALRQSRILPETERLYLVDGNTLPDTLRTETAYGYCSPLLDLLLREHVEWQGRGMGIVIFPQHFDCIERLVGTVTHEACHWFEYATVCVSVGMVEFVTHEPENMRRILREEATLALDAFDVDTNVNTAASDPHNALWHWFVANAAYRLWEFGNINQAYATIAWADDYGLSSRHEYLRAAGGLPAQLAHKPLLSIAGMAPAKFVSLFEKDHSNVAS